MRAYYDKDAISAASVDYLMLGGYVSLAAHWLKMEAAACAALAKPADARSEEAAFYTAKRQTSAFVFERLLPRTRAHRAAMLAPTASLMELPVESFSFDQQA